MHLCGQENRCDKGRIAMRLGATKLVPCLFTGMGHLLCAGPRGPALHTYMLSLQSSQLFITRYACGWEGEERGRGGASCSPSPPWQ